MTPASNASSQTTQAIRLRPGERPEWWSAEVDRADFPTWRAAATEHGICVDVLVSTLVELDLVIADLTDVTRDPDRALEVALTDGLPLRRLGPAGALRDWLKPAPVPAALDELPELVLPARLIARLTPGSALSPRVRLDRCVLALACDQHAATHGRTLESWALSTMLRATRRSPAPS